MFYLLIKVEMSRYLWTGSNQADAKNANDLYRENPAYSNFKLEGLAGDDNIGSSIISRTAVDQIDGGDGDDFLTGNAYRTNSATIIFNGGLGTDEVYFPISTISSISRVGNTITEAKATKIQGQGRTA